MNKLLLTLLIAFTLLSQDALASENRYQQFNSDAAKAYSAYRIALFQTNKQNVDKSTNAVHSFLQQWQQIEQEYGQNPPEVFSTDAKWTTTLATIEEAAQKSLQQINEKKLTEAHETLEIIRNELSTLRKRNSVINFSDHINNYHQVMEQLLTTGVPQQNIPPELENKIQGQLAVLFYLAENIKANAPEEYVTNTKYVSLQEGVFSSLSSLQQALNNGNPEEIKTSIKMLKPAYAKLFVNFG